MKGITYSEEKTNNKCSPERDVCNTFLWPGLSDIFLKPCFYIAEPFIQISNRNEQKDTKDKSDQCNRNGCNDRRYRYCICSIKIVYTKK